MYIKLYNLKESIKLRTSNKGIRHRNRTMANKKLVIISMIIVLLGARNATAQVPLTTIHAIESQITVGQEELTKLYKTLLEKEFTRISTGSTSKVGTYAKLSTKDDLVDFNGTIDLGKKSNLGITLKGGVTEGLVPLLNGGETSPNITAGLTFNFGVFDTKDPIYIDGTLLKKYKYDLQSLNIGVKKKKDEIDLLKSKKKLEIQTSELKKKKLVELLTAQRADSNSLELLSVGDKNYNKKELLVDSIKLAMSSTSFEQVKIDSALSLYNLELINLNDASYASVLKQIEEETKVKKSKDLLGELKLLGYKLSWFSFGAKITNRTFKSFADSLAYDNQLTKVTYNRVEFTISRSTYILKSDKGFNRYSSLGLSYSLDDNFDDLAKVTLSDAQVVSSSPVERTIKGSKTGYVGEYIRDISRFKLYYDFYWFLNKSRTFAVHVNPNFTSDLRSANKANLRLGLLIEFQDQAKEKSVINAEFFYNITNLFGEYDDGERFDDRTVIGVSLNTPIIFNRNK